ncbi:MAG: DUF4430 domain-containing protein [Lachnospiraceae bacterium]|nr:DUF4430 domain-containing protein [Lachnospiraceae bacterium]
MKEKTNTSNKKKLLFPAVLTGCIILFAVLYLVFSPKAVEGSKALSITVVDAAGAETEYTVHTNAEYLRQALEETEGLTVEGDESTDYGLMVTTVNGLYADMEKDGAYWGFYVDDEYCQYGVENQPVEDGQAYRIVYETMK